MLVLVILLFIAASVGSAQEPVKERPKFEDYPVVEVFEGAPAPVVLDSPAKRRYRTRITEGSKQKPNFAGHYSFVEWGCGSNCSAGAVVDLKTGEVLDPFSFHRPTPDEWMICASSWEPIQFQEESRLIIVPCGTRGSDDAYVVVEGSVVREIAHYPGTGRYREQLERARRDR